MSSPLKQIIRSAPWMGFLFTTQLAWAQTPIRPFSPTWNFDPELSGAPQQTVVLLTSLNLRMIPLFIRETMFHNYFGRLEGIFRSYVVDRGFRVRAVHEADQYDLWSTLQDPTVVGVVWVSHGAGAFSGAGVGSEGALVDYQAFNVLPALQGIHPNLRFLGVVGCKSQEALEAYLRNHGVYQRNPKLVFQGFEGTIDARQGLHTLMPQAMEVLDQPSVKSGFRGACPVESGYGIRVRRQISHGYASQAEAETDLNSRPVRRRIPALRVQQRDQVLHIFPPAWNGALQERVVNIRASEALESAVELKFISNVGENYWRADRPLEVGTLFIQAPWSGGLWELFARPDGTPMGVSAHVYRYRGTLEFDIQPEEYRPFICRDIPARID
jgi:hypothetical protein